VSLVGLGTNNFGGRIDLDASRKSVGWKLTPAEIGEVDRITAA